MVLKHPIKKGYCKKENRNGKSECIPNMLNVNRVKCPTAKDDWAS
ncbi:hypothetical protein HpNP105_15150 [Helicobacter pylori]